MEVSPGTRIGPYEIVALLGKGGMGEVYRARDLRLKREVALKILPDSFATDADRLRRFVREAEVLASLNHPNIAAIFEIERAAGTTALVLELVEGPTLDDRIAQGRLPLDKAMPIARQIAEALEAAHERGVVHRDLKPANIKVRPDGLVKILDFGLAKALDPAPASRMEDASSAAITAPATHAGIILGTPAYMPPEQAQGQSVDKVADVWAFGAVVYEMITGRRAFAGPDVSTTLARVIEREPDWTALPSNTPPAIRHLLRRCLEKDPRRRLRDIGEARIAIDDELAIGRSGRSDERDVTATRLSPPTLLTIVAATFAAGVAVTIAVSRAFTDPPVTPSSQASHFTIVPAPAQSVSINGLDRDLVISPDGRHVVYVGGAARQLIVRSLDRLDAMPLAGTEGARMPFVSPDSRSVGFFVGEANELRKVAIAGGPSVPLCQYEQGPRGASWAPDDTVVFATSDTSTGLLRVASGGGDPEVLTRPDSKQGERDHLFPSMLPGGGAVLFTIVRDGGIDTAKVAVLNLATGERTTLITGGTHPEYVEAATASGPIGYIVYSANGTLRAVRFDAMTRQVLGDPAPVVEQVMSMGSGAAQFAVSRQGTLVYVPGGGQIGTGRSLVWLTRQGQEEPIKAPARAYTHPRLSPDDSRVALDVFDQEQDIWIWDLRRESMTRFTLDAALDIYPTWTADSRRLIFASTRSGEPSLYWQPADGTGTVAQLTAGAGVQYPYSVTPDGTHLVLSARATNQGADLNLLRLDRPDERHAPLVHTSFEEINAEFSNDGRWLAYQSNESGRNEVYVRPFPDVDGGRWQVSTGGGSQPLWARDGRELFFLDGDNNLMSVGVPKSASFTPGNPTRILGTLAARYFTAGPGRTYDVSRDGRQFLMIRTGVTADLTSSTTASNIVVVVNWLEELKQRVPTR